MCQDMYSWFDKSVFWGISHTVPQFGKPEDCSLKDKLTLYTDNHDMAAAVVAA